MPIRNPDSAAGDWYIDTACIDCSASRNIAPDLIAERNGKCVFARQPATPDELTAAWRARLLCPTASVRTESAQPRPRGLFPQELAQGVYRCGYNARASWGAHSYFAARPEGNLLVDSPRHTVELRRFFERAGGIAHILLTHQDDVADADKYAAEFGARVWIHEADAHAAPYANERIRGDVPVAIRDRLSAIPVPGHTRGSVAYLLEDSFLFTGDSLAWSFDSADLTAFRDACWYSWNVLAGSLESLLALRFEWVLAGHGASMRLPAEEMRERLRALVLRMRQNP